MTADISSNVEYLAAKKAIDQRSLSRYVWDELWRHCPAPPLQIMELGAGLGTMIERLLEAGKISQARYLALDLNSDLLSRARQRLQAWAETHKYSVSPLDNGLRLQRDPVDLELQFHQADISRPLAAEIAQPCDLLLGNALLDLVDIPSTLPALLDLVQPEGLFYFSITFDGVTHFEPVIDDDLDSRVMELYHRTMDERGQQSGLGRHSRSGRLLLGQLQQLGAELLAAGGSDWVVHPQQGGYSADEITLLRAILDTIEGALSEQGYLDEADLQAWLTRRRQQLQSGQLIFITHQLDVCGRPPAAARGQRRQ